MTRKHSLVAILARFHDRPIQGMRVVNHSRIIRGPFSPAAGLYKIERTCARREPPFLPARTKRLPMADHTIRKVSHSGAGYSVVDLNDVRHVFAAATPCSGFDLQPASRRRLANHRGRNCARRARGDRSSIRPFFWPICRKPPAASRSCATSTAPNCRRRATFPSRRAGETAGRRGPWRGAGPGRSGDRTDQRRTGRCPP